MQIQQRAIDYHRNGITGAGFYLILFTWKDRATTPVRTRRMLATVFSEDGHVAVVDVDETARENIGFAKGNSWSGDDFEPALRRLITAYEAKE